MSAQIEIGPNVTVSFCLFVHASPLPLFSRHPVSNVSTTCLLVYTLCKTVSSLDGLVHSNLTFLFGCRSVVMISELKQVRVGDSGPCISQSKGKDDLSMLFILGRQQEECRSSCSIPAGRSHPCEFQSATATTLPLLTRGGSGCIQALYM